MKVKSLIFMLVAIMILVPVFSSCASEQIKTNVTLKFVAGDQVLFNSPVEVAGEAPTVMLAVMEATAANTNLLVEISEDGRSVNSANGFAAKQVENYKYYWEFTVNGELPDSGTADTVAVSEGTEIVFSFNYVKMLENGKFEYGSYDPSLGHFGESGEAAE